MPLKSEQSALSRTFEIAQENTGWVALWCGLSVAIDFILVIDNLSVLVLGILTQLLVSFYFYKALLASSGYQANEGNFGSFLAVSVVMGLGIGLGALLLIVPGIFLSIRWFIAIQILLSEGVSPLDAMSQSWERTRGKAGEIFVSLLPALGLWVVSSIWFVMVDDQNVGSLFVPAVIGGFGGALFFCCSMAFYELLSAPNESSATAPSN